MWFQVPSSLSDDHSSATPPAGYNSPVNEKPTPFEELIQSPEDFVYRSVYAPVDVGALLASAETRGRLRRLPVPQLFFGIQQLEEGEIAKLLPHVTEQQWAGILDLGLWTKDEAAMGEFLYWQKNMSLAEDPVARKLLRATDSDLWQLLFKQELEVYVRVEEDEYEEEVREGDVLETPDKNFLIRLPDSPEKARLLRALISRLYELDADYTAILVSSALARTSIEMEEEAYQRRKRRVEDMGFQDYFDAIEIYSFLPSGESLPQKQWDPVREISTLPVRLQQSGPWLLFQALATIDRPQEYQTLLEELFFVCNKVLSADGVSPAEPDQVRQTILKAVSGLNLGLDCWSAGNLQKAASGLRQHYLLSFFQVGHSRLVELRNRVRKIEDDSPSVPAGSFLESLIEGLSEIFPMLSELEEGEVRRRFFRTREDVEQARQYLQEILPAEI